MSLTSLLLVVLIFAASCCDVMCGSDGHGDHSHDAIPEEDASVVVAGVVALDGKLSFKSDVDGGHVTFNVTFVGTQGWFGVGVSADGSMSSKGAGSDVVVCHAGGAERYWLTSKNTPTGGSTMDGATCEFSGGRGFLMFTRALKAKNDKERDMLAVGEMKLIYAHSTNAWPVHHDARGAKIIDLSAISTAGNGAAISTAGNGASVSSSLGLLPYIMTCAALASPLATATATWRL